MVLKRLGLQENDKSLEKWFHGTRRQVLPGNCRSMAQKQMSLELENIDHMNLGHEYLNTNLCAQGAKSQKSFLHSLVLCNYPNIWIADEENSNKMGIPKDY